MPVPNPLRRLATVALCAALTACTGTEESGRAFNVVVQDGETTLRLVGVQDTGAPSASAPVTTASRVTDLATVEAGFLLGVAFTDRLELRGANATTPVRTIGAVVPAGTPGASPAPDYNRNGLPDYVPCYRQVEPNQSGTRLALFSDIGANNDLGCPAGAREQWVALYASSGTLLFNALLPAPLTTDPRDVHLAVLGEDLFVARRSGALEVSEIDRIRADGNPNDGVVRAQVDVLNTSTPLIRDLAVLGSTLYAATEAGVRTVAASGVLGDPVAGFTERADRLWTAQGILAAWNGNPTGSTGTLTLRYRSGDDFTSTLVLTSTSLQNLRDVVIGPDGYLYVILPGSVQRYDLSGFSRGNIRTPSPEAVSSGLQGDARAAAYVVP
ncbi:hypothetical protein [Deinococcus peraridilitoris]|uniref:Glucose/sorbosone dehydrogenase n=1 Tax=Deinococcus peraridilitoris (strain DSM 19664 / LMG 22246 / CIP 109416 / KR-200) TaxID=937777 RepID=K9ZXM4_DEIPD|nr:hypothetical protein [Deinococcus peraridilitoris]AFZ66418.1 hypothetical protein Deipe_0844 [Deinococcus peraridilitoris DSM 19664]